MNEVTDFLYFAFQIWMIIQLITTQYLTDIIVQDDTCKISFWKVNNC